MKDFICDTIIWISLIGIVVEGIVTYREGEDGKRGKNRRLQEAVERQWCEAHNEE